MKSLLKPFIHLKTNISKKINPNYLKKKLEKRKGSCRKCGQCCKGCKFLDKETNLCNIYKKRRILCYQDFPLSKFDQKVWNVKNPPSKWKLRRILEHPENTKDNKDFPCVKNCGYHFQ